MSQACHLVRSLPPYTNIPTNKPVRCLLSSIGTHPGLLDTYLCVVPASYATCTDQKVLVTCFRQGYCCLQAFSVSIDGSAAILDSSANASAALVRTLQQSIPGPDSTASIAALQCLANLTRTHRGVAAALQALLPACLVALVTQVKAILHNLGGHLSLAHSSHLSELCRFT